MNDNKDSTNRPQDPAKTTADEAAEEQAAEWGERIDTGKTIQRGGKESGSTPGAQEQ